MQVYGFPLSPFVRKVLLVAAYKGIAVESVISRPGAPSPEFLEASPFRKIPALRDGDFTLADSTAIATYMDALHPEPAIFPAEARARGKAIWFEEFADTIIVPAGAKIVFNRFVAPRVLGRPGDEAAAEQGMAEIAPILDYLEGAVPAEGWLTGDTFSIGDIAVASVLRTIAYAMPSPDPDRHPATAAWFARVSEQPCWRAVAEREAAAVATLG